MEQLLGLQEHVSSRRPDTSSSTPFTSADCSPRSSTDQAVSCFSSATTPAQPIKVTLKMDSLAGLDSTESPSQLEDASSEDFDFSARFSEADQFWASTPMSSADELFCNGRIRPLWYTGQHLHCSNFTQFEHVVDDSENDYYYQSSADYKFSMLSQQQSYTSAMDAYGLSSRYYDHQLCLDEVVSDVSADDADEALVARTVVDNPSRQTRQTARRHQDVCTVAKPSMNAKVERSRGRRTGGGSIGRTRSLSPLRVFHMDDDLPKQQIENQLVKSFEDGDSIIAAERKQKWEGDEITRHGARVTLKDLLHASEKEKHGFASKAPASSITKQRRKAHLETNVSERKSRSLPKQGVADRRKLPYHTGGAQGPGSPRARHYSSPNVHSERSRQQTFLPYRRGLLACLGFSSKRYWSAASMRSCHSRSQGMR